VFYGIIHPEAVNNSLQIADCPNTIQRWQYFCNTS
jgi:hypothetical protein